MLKRVFSAHLKMWHLALVVVFLAMGTGSTSAAQTAMSPQVTSSLAPTAFFPNGAFNMAAAQSNTAMTVHAADGQVEVLRATFKVPTGQVADVAAFFNAEAYKYPNGYCYLQSFIDTIGGTSLSPGELWSRTAMSTPGPIPRSPRRATRAQYELAPIRSWLRLMRPAGTALSTIGR